MVLVEWFSSGYVLEIFLDLFDVVVGSLLSIDLLLDPYFGEIVGKTIDHFLILLDYTIFQDLEFLFYPVFILGMLSRWVECGSGNIRHEHLVISSHYVLIVLIHCYLSNYN